MLVMLFPAVWVVLTSFRQYSEINANPTVWIPREITFDAYINMFGGNPEMVTQAPIPRYALNAIIVALFSTTFAVVLGTAAGYAFSRFKFRGHSTLFLGMMLARAAWRPMRRGFLLEGMRSSLGRCWIRGRSGGRKAL